MGDETVDIVLASAGSFVNTFLALCRKICANLYQCNSYFDPEQTQFNMEASQYIFICSQDDIHLFYM